MDNKLTIEMIPKTCWGQNLRKVVTHNTWKELKLTLSYSNEFFPDDWQCTICNKEFPSSRSWDLHEVWEFDIASKTQRLTGLLALCDDCHAVKHFGLSCKQGKTDRVIQQLRKVNGWNDQQIKKHIIEAQEKWEKLSEFSFKLDVSYAEKWLSKKQIHPEWLIERKGQPTSQYEAIQWARKLLKDDDFLLLDTETTGLLKNPNAEIIELSVVSSKRDVLFNSLIKPKYKIPREIGNYTGIFNKDVKDAPVFSDVYNDLKKVIQGKRLVAFNANFDRGILNQTCDLYELPHIEADWECAFKTYQAYRDFPKSGCHLPMAAHNALDDCCATMRLLFVMAENGNPKDLDKFPAPWLD